MKYMDDTHSCDCNGECQCNHGKCTCEENCQPNCACSNESCSCEKDQCNCHVKNESSEEDD